MLTNRLPREGARHASLLRICQRNDRPPQRTWPIMEGAEITTVGIARRRLEQEIAIFRPSRQAADDEQKVTKGRVQEMKALLCSWATPHRLRRQLTPLTPSGGQTRLALTRRVSEV